MWLTSIALGRGSNSLQMRERMVVPTSNPRMKQACGRSRARSGAEAEPKVLLEVACRVMRPTRAANIPSPQFSIQIAKIGRKVRTHQTGECELEKFWGATGEEAVVDVYTAETWVARKLRGRGTATSC
jgi:hypothetical protein